MISSSAAQRAPRGRRAQRRRNWALAVLVGALLSGLFSMHGLSPSPVPHQPHHSLSGSHPGHHARGHLGELPDPTGPDAGRPGHSHLAAGCANGDPDGGHTSHADVTCAAGGISGGPVIAVPATSTPPGAQLAAAAPGGQVRATPVERAPPSLHQLQLLRI